MTSISERHEHASPAAPDHRGVGTDVGYGALAKGAGG